MPKRGCYPDIEVTVTFRKWWPSGGLLLQHRRQERKAAAGPGVAIATLWLGAGLLPRSSPPLPALSSAPSKALVQFDPTFISKAPGGQPPGLAGRRAGTPAGLARRCHVAWHPGVPSEMERWHPDVVRAPGCVCVGGGHPQFPCCFRRVGGHF